MWIARDKDGSLYVYTGDIEMTKGVDEWNGSIIERLHPLYFPEVKWEDEEPTEVELVIKKNKRYGNK